MDRNRNNNGNNNNNDWSWWQIGAAAVGAGATLGTLYALTRSSSEPSQSTPQHQEEQTPSFFGRFANDFENLFNNTKAMEDIIPQGSIPAWPHITNLNSLLSDIYDRYVALKREEFQRHYNVFTEIFGELQRNMKKVDKYYERFASDVRFAGSHFDNLRIKKPDEFDMDIVIGLPVNMRPNPYNPEDNDVVIEQNYPGYVQLRAGVQYQKLLVRDGSDCQIYRTAYEWLDERKYILRSKFVNWFKSVGYRALNEFQRVDSVPALYVNGILYKIRCSESGPAWTIIIEAPKFRLDVDLVPALKFPETRWPVGKSYRPIPAGCEREYWMVVPKPNKNGNTVHDEYRSWRIALQDQEKKLLYNTFALRKTLRLIKKLRDALGMKKIASYYIKTIFFWEIMELKYSNPLFWQSNDIATLLKHMVKKLHSALEKGEIPYFWNKSNNLIGNINQSILNEYKCKTSKLLAILEVPANYREVAKYLLDNEEYSEYKKFLF
ncbi:unnamed protein product, partial [Brenthis ino]